MAMNNGSQATINVTPLTEPATASR